MAAASTPWEITPAGKTPGLGAMVRIGARAVPLLQVRGVIGSLDRDTDRRPALLTVALFGVIACVFLFGVVDLGWRERFLLGAVVFGGIGLMALNDLMWLSTGGIYRVEILLASGETLRYATVDPADQERLLNAVGRHVLAPVANDVVRDAETPARRPAVA
jgi:hypothetical protein